MHYLDRLDWEQGTSSVKRFGRSPNFLYLGSLLRVGHRQDRNAPGVRDYHMQKVQRLRGQLENSYPNYRLYCRQGERRIELSRYRWGRRSLPSRLEWSSSHAEALSQPAR